MKTNRLFNIFIGLAILCLSNTSIAQAPENKNSKKLTNNYVVEYDFNTGLNNINTVKPKVHFPLIYRIKNINRYAYKIEVKSKDSVLAFSFSLDGLPKEIFVPKKNEQETLTASLNEGPKSIPTVSRSDVKDIADDKNQDKKNDLVQVLNSAVYLSDLNKQMTIDTEKLKKISDNMENNTLVLKSLNLGSRTDSTQINPIISSIKTEITNLNQNKVLSEEQKALLENFKNVNGILEDQKKLIADKNKVLNNIESSKKDKAHLETTQEALKTFVSDNAKLNELFSQFRQTYRKVNKINRCYEELYELITDHQLTYNLAQKKVEPFKKRQEFFSEDQNQIDLLKSLYYDIQVQYGIIKRNFTLNEKLNEAGKAKLYGQADDYMDRAKNMFEKINLADVQKKLNLMPIIIRSLDNPDTFEWKSSPVQPIGDVVTFSVDIQAKNKTENKILNERKFRHQEFTYGGTRIDFGLGLAASYFSKTSVYELQVEKIDNLSKITIQQKNDQLIVPSLIGLATMSYRSSQYICYGASAGLGIDVINGKIQLNNFYAGPSITFGRYERLTFTTGASLRNVQQLKSGYEIGSSVTETADDIENYLTDKYKIGFFASLTFVLTKGMKENLNKIPTYR